MRKITFSIIILFPIHLSMLSAQKENGAYLSKYSYKQNSPEYNADFFGIKQRTKTNIAMVGGNDYKVECLGKDVSKKTIKNDIWAVVKNDTLYLNALPITGLMGYAKAEVAGRYCALKVAIPNKAKYIKELSSNDVGNVSTVAILGGPIIGGIAGASQALKRILIVYDTETGARELLNLNSITKLLTPYDDLKEQFSFEVKKEDEEILLKYLILINEKEVFLE